MFRKILLLTVLLISFSILQAQVRISSPYSRYGIGDILRNNNTKFMSMGNIGIACRSSKSVNYVNPASYTSFDSVSLIFEGSLISSFSTLQTNGLEQKSNYTSLGSLLFGFPVTGWLKASFGMVPYSSVGYKISDHGFIDEIGNIDYTYEGDGGISRFYLGQAIKISPDLSLGINVSFLLGSLGKTRSAFFPDSTFVMNSRIINKTTMGGFYFNYGLQYHKTFDNDFFINTGFVYGNSSKLNAKDDLLIYTYQQSVYGNVYIRDTIDQKTNQEGTIQLPSDFGAGITFGNTGKWMFGMDYSWQNWNNYSYFGSDDSLKNSSNISIGGEFVPGNTSVSSYFKRIHYRFGARYGKTYLELKENQLNEFGFSIGFGFPLKKRSSSTLNLGIEYGERGTSDDNLIKENYFKINFGFSIYERWFIKPKYF